MNPEICVAPDIDALNRAAAERFARLARQVVERSGRFCVALAGGATPRGMYALLAEDVELRADMPWAQTHFFWGDERLVVPEHSESNYCMANDAMFSHVPLPPENIHPMGGGALEPERAAEAYERELRAFFQLSGGQFPRFDLALLGLGADGHTASLFPGTAALRGRRRLVVTSRGASASDARLSLSVPVFNNASSIAFLVAGRAKAQAVWATLRGPHAPTRYPAQLIAPPAGRTVWMLDPAAAAMLDNRTVDAAPSVG